MYRPPLNVVEDARWIEALLAEDPFATVIAAAPGEPVPWVSHLPLLFDKDEGGKYRLTGHLARANRQYSLWKEHPRAYAVFHGPHGFVTPAWYEENDVPTWNYAVVHLEGRVRLVEDYAGIDAILRRSAEAHAGEAAGAERWRYSLPDDLADPAVVERAIAGFVIEVESVEAKFKLSQNRSRTDQERVVAGLKRRADDASVRLARLMGRFLGIS